MTTSNPWKDYDFIALQYKVKFISARPHRKDNEHVGYSWVIARGQCIHITHNNGYEVFISIR